MKISLPHGRPTIAEVDLGALVFNYRQIQKRIQKGVRILAVVKADAYGHGALPISQQLEKIGVEYLGVAIAEEGVELRKGGVKTPILVLGGIYGSELDQVFRFNLTPVVFRKDSLQLLSREAEKRGKEIRVHLKVDTGMGRLGVPLNLWPLFGRGEAISDHQNRRHPFALLHDGRRRRFYRSAMEGFSKSSCDSKGDGNFLQISSHSK